LESIFTFTLKRNLSPAVIGLFSSFCKWAAETCTHCHYSLKNIARDREARHHFDEGTKLFEGLSEKYPKLRELKQPGDHLKIEDQD